MALQLPLYNLLISLMSFLSFSLMAYLAWRFVFRKPLPKQLMAGWALLFIALAWWSFDRTNAPRFALTEEAGSAPEIEGEVSSKGPSKMTDEQRVQYNRSLNAENSISPN